MVPLGRRVAARRRIASRTSSLGEASEDEKAGEDERAGAAGGAKQPDRRARRRSGPRRREIRRGDNLWSIAERQLGENASDRQVANRVVRIARLNELRDPDLILAGESLRLRA